MSAKVFMFGCYFWDSLNLEQKMIWSPICDAKYEKQSWGAKHALTEVPLVVTESPCLRDNIRLVIVYVTGTFP